MPRRVELPGASELFRPTTAQPPAAVPSAPAGEPGGRGSGRVRHEEKITVYVSSQELLALEQARLALRAEHGLAVDRGRIVRTAISLAVADLLEHGGDSDLVRGLGES
ncbi:hypothetical protein ATK74_1061 [Propionicimonas paludicola]|uniref:Cobyrinic acid a,c-diamide synthase n=1 Tax=Propionicimonas paludicola TaxID=185243 RepID=A0A2A9CQW7_9ACTN|nr:hypothetical protein [Propionicimonas paludicola]PFG16516.1 hypothetical protein ATK74_1061 [Propionicimonas paludicola]